MADADETTSGVRLEALVKRAIAYGGAAARALPAEADSDANLVSYAGLLAIVRSLELEMTPAVHGLGERIADEAARRMLATVGLSLDGLH